jgi:hypothetical protein
MALDQVAIAVRDALLASTDPSDLLFSALPQACGLKGFNVDDRRDLKRTEAFIAILRDAIFRLRDAYADLIAQIGIDLITALGMDEAKLDRAKIAAHAARVAVVAQEGRLKAFSQRLRDAGLEEEAWIESLASFVVSKPPHRWAKADKELWGREIFELAALFLRTEAAAYARKGEPTRDAVRIGLTRADGREMARVVELSQSHAEQSIAQAIQKMLPKSTEDRLTVLYFLLWDALNLGQESTIDSGMPAVREKCSG